MFLKLCARNQLAPAEVETQLEDIQSWGVHKSKEYEVAQRQFAIWNNNRMETEAYDPFITMGNMFLKRAEEKWKLIKKVRLLKHYSYKMEDGRTDRKPYIILVPKTVEERVMRKKDGMTNLKTESIDYRKALVPEVLVPFEMKAARVLSTDPMILAPSSRISE